MEQRVLRRNRRTASIRIRPKRDLAILAVSLIIFLGGSGGLAWAMLNHPSQDAEPARSSPQRIPEQDDFYTGIIMPSSNSSTAEDTASTDHTPQGDGIAGAPDEPPLPVADASDDSGTTSQDAIPATPSPSPSPTPSPAPSPNAGAQRGYVIHHTAYREEPVYRIVHHQMSTPREITTAGKTRIEWTSCPVCGQRHAKPYNERAVDHVNPVTCNACSGRHDADYNEVVYE